MRVRGEEKLLMDPISADALTALIVRAAAGEAGKSAWAGLQAIARRAFKRSHAARGVLEHAATGDHEAAHQAAEQLVVRARSDQAVSEALRAWMTEALAQGGVIANNVSGDARINGNVVQARDIQGPVSFR